MNDLAIPHPTRPGLWKIVGRADEQIVLSNGEKTNPVPLGSFELPVLARFLVDADVASLIHILKNRDGDQRGPTRARLDYVRSRKVPERCPY